MTIIKSTPLHYRLHIADEAGKTIREIIKDYDPVKITDEDKEKDIKGRFGDRGISLGVKLKFPEYYPAFWHLSTDDEGRICVQTFERTEKGSYHYDFFDSEGKHIAKVPPGARPQTWKNGSYEFDLFNREGYYLYRVKIPVLPEIIQNSFLFEVNEDQETGEVRVRRFKIKNWDQIKEGI